VEAKQVSSEEKVMPETESQKATQTSMSYIQKRLAQLRKEKVQDALSTRDAIKDDLEASDMQDPDTFKSKKELEVG
tara:strand:+ start:136 stop:363 length:228 start_codon:yes stop_codon:yes gene_type:complete